MRTCNECVTCTFLHVQPDAGTAAYLAMAVEELRTAAAHDALTEQIRKLPGIIRALTNDTRLLGRSEMSRPSFNEASRNISSMLVSTGLGVN